MMTFQVDLTNCDHEPIHIPGQIQSHGFLLAIDQGLVIRYSSDNTSLYIPGFPENGLGQLLENIEPLFGSLYPVNMISNLVKTGLRNTGFERVNPIPAEIAGCPYFVIISKSGDYFLIEFERAESKFDLDVQSVMGKSIAEILSFRKTGDLINHSAKQVKQVIQFDRVMIYRFADDGHGEVVAEAKNEDLEPWLGLHYPASDIPQQARALYKLNLTRLIADVNTTPSKISTASDSRVDLDLTYSQLRAVSPIHIQYLKNMGVASSFSISLIYKGELWGLIACHNYTPRFIDYKSREYAKLIGQILSSALEFRQDEETQAAESLQKINLDKLTRQLLETDNIEIGLTAMPLTILNAINATGAVLAFDKKLYKLGLTPNDVDLIKLFHWINNTIKEPVFYTANLSAAYPEAVTYRDIASGMLVSVLSKELGDYLVWFKPEQIENINWAGNPEKVIEINASGLLQISPRNSFEAWAETVNGVAEKWSEVEIAGVTRLKDDINFGIQQKAGAMRLMNERLKQAYEELETFSYTISHDLKNPIASIKSYAQLLMRDQAVLEKGQKMLQRIADRADQMNLMINAVLDYSKIGRSAIIYRQINCGNLVADIVSDLHITNADVNIKITVGEMPDLKGDPIMILQVFSNLISNAVKYSQDSNPAEVHITGEVLDKKTRFTISDNGLGIAKKDIPKIFELFNRMDNVSHIEGSGVGLAIVKRIVEKHSGKIWADSTVGEGSIFYVEFANQDKTKLS